VFVLAKWLCTVLCAMFYIYDFGVVYSIIYTAVTLRALCGKGL